MSLQTALKQIMDKHAMELDLIVNPKVTEEGSSVVQVRHIYNLATGQLS